MHQGTDSVVAILDDRDQAQSAMRRLGDEGFDDAELLQGEQGRSVLNDDDETGLINALSRMMQAMGDEVRIRERLDAALVRGASVISVGVDSGDAEAVSEILQDHGGHDMWRLGEWSQNRIGGRGSGEG